jgi:ABC-2 type transport system permease protein
MKILLRTEARKLAKSPAFWLIMILYSVSTIVILSGSEAFINKVVGDAQKNSPIPIPEFSLYAFPNIWHNLTYIAGLFKFLLAFTVILFICNEFTYRTIRQHIITGMSREGFFLSKLLSTTILSLYSTLLLFLTGTILGFLYSNDSLAGSFTEKLHFLPVYFLEVFAYLSFAAMIAFLTQKAGVAVILFVVYAFIAEPALSFKLHEDISWFLPLKTFGRMIDIPNTSLMKLFGVNFSETVKWADIIMTIVYSTIANLVILVKVKLSDF